MSTAFEGLDKGSIVTPRARSGNRPNTSWSSISKPPRRFSRIVDPLRPRALMAFEEFFFRRPRDVYPRYDFARMNDDEYRATLGLENCITGAYRPSGCAP